MTVLCSSVLKESVAIQYVKKSYLWQSWAIFFTHFAIADPVDALCSAVVEESVFKRIFASFHQGYWVKVKSAVSTYRRIGKCSCFGRRGAPPLLPLSFRNRDIAFR